jgi:hypothetical protein
MGSLREKRRLGNARRSVGPSIGPRDGLSIPLRFQLSHPRTCDGARAGPDAREVGVVFAGGPRRTRRFAACAASVMASDTLGSPPVSRLPGPWPVRDAMEVAVVFTGGLAGTSGPALRVAGMPGKLGAPHGLGAL